MKLRLLTVPLLFGTLLAFPDGNSSTSGTPTPSTRDKKIIVILKRNNDKGKYGFAPAKPIDAHLWVYDSELTLSTSISGDIFELTVEKIGDSQSTWNGFFMDSYEMTIPFDGQAGEYQVNVTSENVTYIGYFEI